MGRGQAQRDSLEANALQLPGPSAQDGHLDYAATLSVSYASPMPIHSPEVVLHDAGKAANQEGSRQWILFL